VRRVIEAARDAGIGQLTLYSFSTENWNRPSDEVEGLMNLHAEMIEAEVPTLHKNDCRVCFVGSRKELNKPLLEKMEWAESLTADNRRMVLFIAFNYGGRQEVIEAFRAAVSAGADPSELTEEDVSKHLYSPIMRDPDLCIRTSGEKRLSNFLLWQSAYSELLFSDKLWPDWGKDDFDHALAEYGRRERRFGARGGDADG
jgi:undecaprenyl diphosphate synthase